MGVYTMLPFNFLYWQDVWQLPSGLLSFDPCVGIPCVLFLVFFFLFNNSIKRFKKKEKNGLSLGFSQATPTDIFRPTHKA